MLSLNMFVEPAIACIKGEPEFWQGVRIQYVEIDGFEYEAPKGKLKELEEVNIPPTEEEYKKVVAKRAVRPMLRED